MAFPYRDLGNPRKIVIASLWAKISTQDLLNMKQEGHPLDCNMWFELTVYHYPDLRYFSLLHILSAYLSEIYIF
jgi:hypothetical protein